MKLCINKFYGSFGGELKSEKYADISINENGRANKFNDIARKPATYANKSVNREESTTLKRTLEE